MVDVFKEDAVIERTTYKLKEKYRVTIHYHFRWGLRGRVRRRKYTELIIEDRSITIKGRVAVHGVIERRSDATRTWRRSRTWR